MSYIYIYNASISHNNKKHCSVQGLVATLHGDDLPWCTLSLSLPPAHPPFFPAGSPLCGRWASLSALRTGNAAFIATCIACVCSMWGAALLICSKILV